MINNLVLLDLFSGIGGFHQGLQQAGFNFKKVYFSEVDKHAIANYKWNYKDAKHLGTVTNIRGADIKRPNIITFGSPCQDFSIAGKRTGMDGERSVLINEAIRLITETRPDVFIWENVKGVFSSNNGEDFWAIIQAFTNIGGYRLEWQLLNTAWFLPQNRQRMYLVGTLATSTRSDRQIFPIEFKTNRVNKRAKQTPNVNCLTAGGHSGGLHSSMTLIKTLSRGYNKSGMHDLSPTITSNSFEHNNFIVSLTGKDQVNTIRSGGRGSNDKKHNWDVVKVGTLRTHKDGEGFRESKTGLCPTIPARAREDGSSMPCAEVNGVYRRLTEIECERLQGYKDNHTKYGLYNGKKKEISATQRYKMIGNAVSPPVVKAVGLAIKEVLFKT